MGTRAVITFKDEFGSVSVYQHWDGDPETVVANIKGTFAVGKCWRWPRWEADEFAAAYVATNKSGEGNIRLTKGARSHGDLSYSYTVTTADGNGAKLLYVRWKGGGVLFDPTETMAEVA